MTTGPFHVYLCHGSILVDTSEKWRVTAHRESFLFSFPMKGSTYPITLAIPQIILYRVTYFLPPYSHWQSSKPAQNWHFAFPLVCNLASFHWFDCFPRPWATILAFCVFQRGARHGNRILWYSDPATGALCYSYDWFCIYNSGSTLIASNVRPGCTFDLLMVLFYTKARENYPKFSMLTQFGTPTRLTPASLVRLPDPRRS